MSRVYESLKVVVHDTLQLGKTAGPLARIRGNTAATLHEELEEIERIIAERIGKLRTAVQEGEAAGAGEAQRAEQLIEGLRENVAALGAKQNGMENAPPEKTPRT